MGQNKTRQDLLKEIAALQSEKASLKAEKEKYRLLVENSNDLPFSVSPRGVVTYVGPQIINFGYEAEDVINRSYLDFIAPDQREEIKQTLVTQEKTGQDVPVECRWITKNGDTYWVETFGKTLYGASGSPVMRIGVMRNITRRKEAEARLKESEEKFRLIAENSGEGLWQLDTAGRLTFVLSPLKKIFGYENKELLGMDFSLFFPEEKKNEMHRVFEKALSGATYQLVESIGKRKDGKPIPVEISVVPIVKGQNVIGVQGIVREITRRKKIENDIARQKYLETEMSKLAAFLLTTTAIPDISYRVLDTAMLMTQSQYGFVASLHQEKPWYFGYAMSDQAWQNCRIENKNMVFDSHVQAFASVLNVLEPQIHDPFGTEVPEGHVRIRSLMTVPAMIGDQRVGQIVLANPDGRYSKSDLDNVERLSVLYAMAIQRQKYEAALLASETRKKEELENLVKRRTHEIEQTNAFLEKEIKQRSQMEKELVQADKMISLGILVSGVAHEINNPNNFIMLNAPLLNDVWNSVVPMLEKQYRQQGDFMVAGLPYSEMKYEVPHLLNGIVEGARRIQRIVKDLKEYSRRDQDAVTESVSINEVVRQSIKLLDSQIKKTTFHFSMTLGKDLPVITGNSQKLGQVAVNLIQNACQALPAPERNVRVTTGYHEDAGEVWMAVEDEGVGIPEDVMPHIMDPFFTTKRDNGGTGLGLAVSANIIKEHGGRIEVDSMAGQYSRFTAFLPIRNKGGIKKIMVVDDDRANREIIYKALVKFGDFKVQKVATGTEASVKLGIDKPDLVILDMQMPDMNGVEICRLINVSPELFGVKVLIVTGYPGSAKVREAAQLGFDRVIAKPFDIKEIMDAVREILHVKNQNKAGDKSI